MKLTIAFQGNVDSTTQSEVSRRLERHRPRFERLLARYRDDLAALRWTFSREGRSGRLHGRAVLQLPSVTLATDAEGSDVPAVVDELARELRSMLVRHRQRLRKDWTYRRKQRRREEAPALAEILEKYHASGRREALAELLTALIEDHRPRVSAELDVLAAGGRIPPGRISWVEVRDEAVARACERFERRPKDEPLSLWLNRLCDEVVQEIADRELESLEFRSLFPGADSYGPARGIDHEVPALEDAILDEIEDEAWARLRVEDLRTEIEHALAEQPPRRRQAFLAHLYDGLDESEIAWIQGRTEDEVRADLDAAREAVRARLRQE